MQDLGKVAFIGGGNMAAALIGGLTQRGLPGRQIAVADPNAQQVAILKQRYGIEAARDNAAAIDGASAVILAVKPQMMRGAAEGLAPHFPAGAPLVISVAAGIPLASLSGWLGSDVPVIRTMPNRPALNGLGATGLYAPASMPAALRERAERIMRAVGITAWVDEESQLDTITALSGSGPAYFFLFMEALQGAAQERGLPADIARRFMLETAFGAAHMARESTESLATLREQVTSKGGTTAAALRVFDAANLRAIVADALTAAEHRSAELAVEFGIANR